MTMLAQILQSYVPDTGGTSLSSSTPTFSEAKNIVRLVERENSATENRGVVNEETIFSHVQSGKIIPLIVGKLRTLNKPKVLMQTLSRWECVIVDINDEEFTARVTRIFPEESSEGNSYEDYVEFELSDVSDGERKLVKEGAIFYWSVGKAKSKSGTVEHKSILFFPRLPAWSEKIEGRAREKAQRIAKILGWGSST